MAEGGPSVDMTVALCTHNPQPSTLAAVLDAVTPQLDDVSEAELVVVDNASSPPVSEGELLEGRSARLVEEPTPGLTAARQAAIENATGDVILFVDDDNVVGPRYLATVADLFSADPALGLLGGRVLPDYQEDPPAWLAEFEPWLAIRRHDRDAHFEATAPPYSDGFPVGAGFAVRRELAVAYLEDCATTSRIEGRLGTALSSGEDTDLALFILSRGSKLAVTGALTVIHVIDGGRLGEDYLERLAAAHITSALALEEKWAGRLGAAVFPGLRQPMLMVIAKMLAAAVLGLWSPRYRVKRRMFTTLARARLGWT